VFALVCSLYVAVISITETIAVSKCNNPAMKNRAWQEGCCTPVEVAKPRCSRSYLIDSHSSRTIFIIQVSFIYLFFPSLHCSAKCEEAVDSNLAAVGTCNHVNTDVE